MLAYRKVARVGGAVVQKELVDWRFAVFVLCRECVCCL